MASNTIAPAAFLSYARFQKPEEQQRVTDLCQLLTYEVHELGQDSFRLFQDTRDIRVGQQWKLRVEDTINSATILIALLTPGFFRSEYCRRETDQFLERERKLGRTDLLFPLYYLKVRELDEAIAKKGAEPNPDHLIEMIKSREISDWRHLRFASLNSAEISVAISNLASQIEEVLHDLPVAPQATPIAPALPPPEATELPRQPASAAAAQKPAAVIAPEAIATHVVDALRGPYRTLTDAFAAAKPGDRLMVRPGTYEEQLVLDKTLEIVGEGKPEEIIVEARDATVLICRTTAGRVAGLTLRQRGRGDHFAVDVGQGRLTLESCRIESDSLAGIAIHGSEAAPIVRNNVIHRCLKSAIVVFDHAQGTLEENDISDNDAFGVVIQGDANPVLRANRIHENEYGGVFADGGRGELDDNTIFNNRAEGVLIANRANPVLRNNQIQKNAKAGVYLFDNGGGTLTGNKIIENRQSGVAIRTHADPVIQKNVIRGNNGKGVWCKDAAAGLVENNDLRYNAFGAFWKSDDCTTRYVGNRE
jgi:F-box protein 11